MRDFAPDAQAGATSTGHAPNSPCSISSDSRSSSLGATVSLPPHAAAAGAAQSDAPCVSVIAPGSPGGATPGWNQDHVVARSAVPNAPMDTSQEVDLASDDASEASEASVATANSSSCDPQSPDDVPVISPPDLAAVLAAQDVTDVLLPEVTAPLVTISIEERALAPAAPLLRVPYLERLLEAVRDGTPLDRLSDVLRPAVLTLLSHDSICGWFSATGQGPISIRFAIMLYHCIIPGDGAASMGEIVLEQRLDQSRNRLREAGLARSTNAQRQLIRD